MSAWCRSRASDVAVVNPAKYRSKVAAPASPAMRKILTTTLLCALLLGQTACGERSQAETDLRPWDSPQAGGAKADWQRDIKARMRNQSEYDSTR
jgi:hypothetical protein